MRGRRIEYMDAMRGLTMILVVYSHICSFCLGDSTMGLNRVFFLFRLPCFFFISGWLFCQPGRVWNRETVKTVISHKFMVQIIPTFIFLLLLAPPPFFFHQLGATKGGYWFTFALFEFFVLYILTELTFKRWGWLFALLLSMLAFGYDVYYNRYFSQMGLLTSLLGALSFMTWRYFLFFYLGTLVKKHFDLFLQWTSRPLVVAGVTLGFVAIALIPHTEQALLAYAVFALGGVLGVVMVFTFFRTFAAAFSKERVAGRCLQYVGTRTLDIYLLHYFFLPRFLMPYGEQLRAVDSLLLEIAVALALALVVLACSLVVSYVLRLSPFLAHYLFGVKKQSL